MGRTQRSASVSSSGRLPPTSRSRSRAGGIARSLSSDQLETIDIIGPRSLHGAMNCPCCSGNSKPLQSLARQPAVEPVEADDADSFCQPVKTDDGPQQRRPRASTSKEEEEVDEDENEMIPSVLSKGVSYTVRRTLVQGWTHKKGSGMDWFGSRAWKPRWASLVLARVDGYGDVDVPLLLIYWYSSSPVPSSQIILSDSVVTVEDDPDSTKWNCYRFQIRHARETGTKTSDQAANTAIIGSKHVGFGRGSNYASHITRNFTCPQEGRDAWVYAINQALLTYEKSKAAAALREKTTQQPKVSKLELIASPPRSPRAYNPNSLPVLSPPRRQSSFEEDKFPTHLVSPPRSRPISPTTAPLSPTFPHKRPLPRPEPRLFGEGLVGLDDSDSDEEQNDDIDLQIPNDTPPISSKKPLLPRYEAE